MPRQCLDMGLSADYASTRCQRAAEMLDDVLPHAATVRPTATTAAARTDIRRMVAADGFRRSLNRLIMVPQGETPWR